MAVVDCSQILKASFSNARHYNYEDTSESDFVTVAYTALATVADEGYTTIQSFQHFRCVKKLSHNYVSNTNTPYSFII